MDPGEASPDPLSCKQEVNPDFNQNVCAPPTPGSVEKVAMKGHCLTCREEGLAMERKAVNVCGEEDPSKERKAVIFSTARPEIGPVREDPEKSKKYYNIAFQDEETPEQFRKRILDFFEKRVPKLRTPKYGPKYPDFSRMSVADILPRIPEEDELDGDQEEVKDNTPEKTGGKLTHNNATKPENKITKLDNKDGGVVADDSIDKAGDQKILWRGKQERTVVCRRPLRAYGTTVRDKVRFFESLSDPSGTSRAV